MRNGCSFPGAAFSGYQSRVARAHPSGGPRDIFPLPVPPEVRRQRTLSRRPAQRIARSIQISGKVREAIQGLNWLAGKPCLENSESFHFSRPDPIQQEVIGRATFLSELAGSLGSLPQVPSPEAALKALLQGRSEYGSVLPTTLAACSLERISLPESLHSSPQALDLLEEEARRYLQCPEQMLRNNDELIDSQFQPYWDPLLRGDNRLYRRFIQKLHKTGYLVYTQRPKCRIGVFFVKKSDGKKIRMIIDARGANMMFKEPPGVQLLTSDGFSRVEVVVPPHLLPGTEDHFNFLQDHKVHIGLSDVKDCFHRLRQPKWLSEYFCMDPIPASWVGLGGTCLDGVELSEDSLIYPSPGSLCMGFTWSLYFAQRINESLMGSVRTLGSSRLSSDRGEAMQFDLREKRHSGTHHYVYVDNLGILSSDVHTVEEGMTEVQGVFEGKGLELHPGEVHTAVRALGCDLRGDLKASRITPERYHKLRQAIEGVLRRKKVSGRILEVIVGHATFAGLTNRILLSIFNTVYKYIHTHYEYPSTLWRTVREELWVFRSLMIYLHSDWTRPWNTYVTASDASLTGFGIVSSVWSVDEVSEVGRCQERCRFKRLGSHSARDSALANAGFIRDKATLEWRAGFMEADEYLAQHGWVLNSGFSEVPAYLLHKDRWTPRLWGKWSYQAGILELEARALVKSLRRIAMSVFGHDVRQLCLTDNMSVCLAFDRSRARNYPLLRQIRIFGAYCLARNIVCTIRWVPSELNNADEPSRIDDDEPSKSLTHAIPVFDRRKAGALSTGPLAKIEEGDISGQAPSKAKGRAFEGGFRQGPFVEEAVFGPVFDDPKTDLQLQPLGCFTFASGCNPSKKEQGDQLFGFNEFDGEWPKEEKEGEGFSPKENAEVSAGSRSCYDGLGPHPFGRPGSQGSHFETVSDGTGFVQEVCPSPWGNHGVWYRSGGGCPFGGISQPDVFRWSSELQRRPSSGRPVTPPPGLWKAWRSQAPKDVAGAQRVQKVDTGQEPIRLPFSSVGCLCCGDEEIRETSYEHLPPSVGVNLCPTIGAAESEGVFFGASRPQHQSGMEPPSIPRRTSRKDKDRRVRYQSSNRLTVPHGMDREVPGVPEGGTSGAASLGLRLRGVPQHLQADQQNAEHRCHSLSNPPQRAIYRPSSQVPISAGGAKKRSVESPEECHAIREECQASRYLGKSIQPSERLRQTVRGKPWGNLAGPRGHTKVLRKRQLSNRYVLDLFAGKAGVSQACTALGFRAKFWDLRYGPDHDLTKRSTQHRIRREIKKGRILACMMAPVCTSFSVARDRTKVIRNRSSPWGIQKSLLTQKEQQSIHTGNQVFLACLRIIRWLDEYNIPYILENPATSKAWYLPPVARHLQLPHVHFVTCHFCQYGTIWKKPTSFLTGNVDSLDLHRITKVCRGPKGICSRTSRPHFQLTGSRNDGTPWTKVAEPYPANLCKALAHVLTAPFHTLSSSKLFESHLK